MKQRERVSVYNFIMQTDVLNYIKISVHPNKLPISVVNSVVDGEGKIADNNTLKAINQQLDEFIHWAAINPKPQTQNSKS